MKIESDMLLKQNLSLLWSSLIISELLKNGLTHFYLSPGMRNAPFIDALNQFPNAKIYLGIDERAMAFRALGAAKSSGQASVLICTSGTALSNYLPAIIEAKKTNIPLFVISADRPIELSMCDANQTIEQHNFFGPHVQGHLNLGAPTEDIRPQVLLTGINNLIFKSRYPFGGPVHFNAPFREPLDRTNVPITKEYIDLCSKYFKKSAPYTQYHVPKQSLDLETANLIHTKLESSKRPIMVVGAIRSDYSKEDIISFAKAINIPCFWDITSSVKYNFSLEDNIIPTFDHSEVYEKLESYNPDLILHLGGRTTGKHYYRYLDENPESFLISANLEKEMQDPSHQTGLRLVCDVRLFCKDLLEMIHSRPLCENRMKEDWKEFTKKKIEIIEDSPLSYPVVSKTIVENIKNETNLYLANSTVIRSFDNYISLDKNKTIHTYSNRGVSGIEGLIASTLGVIDHTKRETTLVIGDVSFIHDLNSLTLLQEIETPLTIILLNNHGGGIFTLLPIAKQKDVLKYITSPHEYDFKRVCEGFNVSYDSCSDVSEFNKKYIESTKSSGVKILEVFISNEDNLSVYNKLKTVKS